VIARTGNQKLDNWEDENIDFVDEECDCRRKAPQIEGIAREGASSHGSEYIIKGNGQNQVKIGQLGRE
jgi:hypothetical protein